MSAILYPPQYVNYVWLRIPVFLKKACAGGIIYCMQLRVAVTKEAIRANKDINNHTVTTACPL